MKEIIKYNKNKCNKLRMMIKSTLKLVKTLEILKSLWGTKRSVIC